MKPKMSINDMAQWYKDVEALTIRACAIYDRIFNIIKKSYCNTKKIDIDILSDHTLAKIENATAIVLSHWDADEEVTFERVMSILKTEAPAKMDRCVAEVFKQLKDKETKPISQKRLKELRSRAFAICTKQLKSKGTPELRL